MTFCARNPTKRVALLTTLVAVAIFVFASPASATLPGRNGLIAYPTEDGIRAMTPKGTHDRLLVRAEGARAPAWAAGGRRLAFSANALGTADGREIFITDLRRSRTRALTRNEHLDDSPAWSSNGRRIVYVGQLAGGRGLFVVRMSGGPARLIRTADFITDVEWSPDGSTIAYVADGNVHVIDAKGRVDTQITSFPAVAGERGAVSISWSPVGRRLAVGTSVGGHCADCDSIWLVRRDGTGLKSLAENRPAHGDSQPLWSPDGRYVAYCSTDFSPENYGARVLQIRNLASGATRTVAERGCGGDWQPLPRR